MCKRLKLISIIVVVFAISTLGCVGYLSENNTLTQKMDKEILLKERVTELWTAMINADRERIYDLYDPFFRIRTTKAWWLGLNVPVKYSSFEIKDITIQGNVAKVSVKVEYSVSHMGLLGKEIKLDKTERIVNDTWLFIDGSWYRQYFDAITDGTFAHY